MANKKIAVTRVFKYFNFLMGFIFFNIMKIRVADGFFTNYSEDHLVLIQQNIGDTITLQCSLMELEKNTKTTENFTYHWYFKQFGESNDSVHNCNDTNNNKDWIRLPCPNNYCKSKLQLKNVTEKWSGFYKCTLNAKLARTFHLNIKNSYIKIPEFLDQYPLNETVSRGSQIVLQCHVYSETYPTINWFRRLPYLNSINQENSNFIVYNNGRAYELLTATNEKSTSKNVYSTKIIINDVQLQDEGYYACLAISLRGHNIRETFLKVKILENEFVEYWSDYSDEVELLQLSRKEFWLQFLIPLLILALVLFPLVVWFCYINNNNSVKIDIKYLEENDQKNILKA